MTKEHKKWLKENEPWEYDALYGDPVTGETDIDRGGFIELFFICLIALGAWGLINLIF